MGIEPRPSNHRSSSARCRDKLLTYERSTEASTADYKEGASVFSVFGWFWGVRNVSSGLTEFIWDLTIKYKSFLVYGDMMISSGILLPFIFYILGIEIIQNG